MYTSHPISAYLPFILLSLALVLLWLRNGHTPLIRMSWAITLFVATLLALSLGQLQPAAVIAILLIATLGWTINRLHQYPVWMACAAILFTLANLALGLHLIPGFHPLTIFHNIQLTADAIPYTLNLNIDKSLIGLFILGLWYQRPARIQSWPQSGIRLLWMLPLFIALIVTLSLLSGYIRYEPKLPDHLGLWVWANLFFTCTAEETFFRGLIQHRLEEGFKTRHGGSWFALLIAALLFGLAHLGGGWNYALLAMVAGFGYGLLYKQTGRIEASILGHFGLNLVHILFFSYPALSR